jgi:hypothetical protein
MQQGGCVSVFAVIAAFALLLGCSSDESPPARLCIPGETRACSGARDCSGAQACEADGQSFGACDCGPAADDAGAPDAEAPHASFVQLGARCEDDSGCGPGLVCWTSGADSFLGRPGGAAGGYCTAACEVAADCAAYDLGSGCAGGLCMLGCFSKDARPGEGKCLDRPELACWSVAALGLAAFEPTLRQPGICQPSCASDEDCAGRACDLALGLCVDTRLAGAPIGAPCVSADDCAGRLCQPSLDGRSICSGLCSFGTFGCGYADNASPREAMCLVPGVFDATASEGIGDVGLCIELCDTAADCEAPASECILDPQVRGRSGYCVLADPTVADAGAPDAGIDGGPAP